MICTLVPENGMDLAYELTKDLLVTSVDLSIILEPKEVKPGEIRDETELIA